MVIRIALLLVLLTVISKSYIQAQSLDENLWVTNGNIHTTALSVTGDTIYVGGFFTYMGPRTGSGVVVNKNADTADKAWPFFNNRVTKAISDGSGGWFVFGTYDRVGKEKRKGLVHLRADKTIGTKFPKDLNVSNMFLHNERLIVTLSPGLRAYSIVTGELLPWSVKINGGVSAIAIKDSIMYIGGSFTKVNDVPRNNIAAVNVNNGNIINDWNPDVNAAVMSLVIKDSRIYAGGTFDLVNKDSLRRHIAEFDLYTGKVTSRWFSVGIDPPWYVKLAISGNTLYVGGHFNGAYSSTNGGAVRNNLAAFDLISGDLTAWDPNIQGSFVSTIFIRDSIIYAGGIFDRVNDSIVQNNVAAFNIYDGKMTSWNPQANRSVYAIAADKSNVFVGGEFVSCGGLTRKHIGAINLSTGRATDFDPNVDAVVASLVVKDTVVYVGGSFGTVNTNVPRRLFAAFNLDGTVNSWDPGFLGSFITSMVNVKDILYIGGGFQQIQDTPIENFAAFNVNERSLTNWKPKVNSFPDKIVVFDTLICIVGNFIQKVNNQERPYSFGVVNQTDGGSSPWEPAFNGKVRSIDVLDSVLYVHGDFTKVNNTVHRNGLAAFKIGTVNPTSWDPQLDLKIVREINAAGGHVYASGVDQSKGWADWWIAALDTVSGLKTDWFLDVPNSTINDVVYSPLQKKVYIAAAAIYSRDSTYTMYLGGVTAPPSGISSVNDELKHDDQRYLTLYPNPVSDHLRIQFSSLESPVHTVEIIDLFGNTVLESSNIVQLHDDDKISIEIQNIPNGFYFLKAQNQQKIFQKLFIIQH